MAHTQVLSSDAHTRLLLLAITTASSSSHSFSSWILLGPSRAYNCETQGPRAFSTNTSLRFMTERYVCSLLPGTQEHYLVMNFLKISWEWGTDFRSKHLDEPEKEILNTSHFTTPSIYTWPVSIYTSFNSSY